MYDRHIPATYPDGTRDDLSACTQNSAHQSELFDLGHKFIDFIHLLVGKIAVLCSLNGVIFVQKCNKLFLLFGTVNRKRPVGILLLKFIDVIALSGVFPARIGTEILRLIEIVAPAADVCHGDVLSVPQHQPGNIFFGNVGEMKPHFFLAAIFLNEPNGALFRFLVSRPRKRIMKPLPARIDLFENKTVLGDRKIGRELFVPHELIAQRKV